MLYGLYLSAAGAKAQSQRQDVVANNVANAATTGFRKQLALLSVRPDHLEEFGGAPPTMLDSQRRMEGGVEVRNTPTLTDRQGPLSVTGRMLDLAVKGDGFLRVERDGQTFLTRNGALSVDDDGTLRTNEGRGTVLSADGNPIVVDPNVPFVVRRDGQVIQENVPVGRIDLVRPADPTQVVPRDDSLYLSQAGVAPAGGTIEQGMLEGSNVEPIEELVELIESARAFQLNINMIQLQSDSLSNLISTVGAAQ